MHARPAVPSRILVPLALVLVGAGCHPERGRGLVVENPSNPQRPFFHDLGNLPHGTRTEVRLLLRNTDPEPVVILSTHPACACTRTKSLRVLDEGGGEAIEGDLERREAILRVPPGGLVEFVIGVYTASVRPNTEKLAIMRLRTSSPNTPFLTFEVHLRAEKLFTVTPGEIRMGEIPSGYGGSSKVSIMTGIRGSGARLLEVLETSGQVSAELDHVFVNGEHVWGLTATFPPNLSLGPRHEKVLLSATDERGEGQDRRLEVEVWANVVPDIWMRHGLHFGVVPLGEPGRLGVELRALVPGARVKILAAEVSGPCAPHVAASFEPQGYVDDEGRGDTWNITLTTDGRLEGGRFEGRLLVRLDDQQTPTVERSFQGYVR